MLGVPPIVCWEYVLAFLNTIWFLQKTTTTYLIMAGLSHADELAEGKIIGAILHPMYQSKARMLAAGLCTASQYDAGMTELVERVTRYYKLKALNAAELGEPTAKDKFDDDEVEEEVDKSPYVQLEKDEIKTFFHYKSGKYLPDVESGRLELGIVDNVGNPQPAIIKISRVTNKAQTCLLAKITHTILTTMAIIISRSSLMTTSTPSLGLTMLEKVNLLLTTPQRLTTRAYSASLVTCLIQSDLALKSEHLKGW